MRYLLGNLFLSVCFITAIAGAASHEPLKIGSQRQLFIDDHVVESMDPRVYRHLNQPLKYRDNPVIRMDQDWEHKGGLSHAGDCGQVFYDPDRKLSTLR